MSHLVSATFLPDSNFQLSYCLPVLIYASHPSTVSIQTNSRTEESLRVMISVGLLIAASTQYRLDCGLVPKANVYVLAFSFLSSHSVFQDLHQSASARPQSREMLSSVVHTSPAKVGTPRMF